MARNIWKGATAAFTQLSANKNKKGEGEESTGAKAVKTAATAKAVYTSAPLLAWTSIVGILTIVLVIAGGALNGVGQAVDNITFNKCNNSISSSGLFGEAEKGGFTVPDFVKDQAKNTKVSNSCKGTGIGYNGDTFPPTSGTPNTDFMVIDALHPNGHNGTDIADACGTPIYAYAGGEVVASIKGSEQRSGEPMGVIIIKHTEEFSSVYYHTKGSTTLVNVGDIVNAGDQIADQWTSGYSTGCHLHIEFRINGQRIDARKAMNAAGYDYQLGVYFSPSQFPPKPVPGAGGGGTIVPVAPGSAKAAAQTEMAAFGWTSQSEWTCLENLWNRESGWRVNAQNNAFSTGSPPLPEYQAYGIPQAGPGSKMASEGADWKTNPATQIRWGLKYIQSRYGTPCGAWAHSEANNWY